jgi:hypothetical protein
MVKGACSVAAFHAMIALFELALMFARVPEPLYVTEPFTTLNGMALGTVASSGVGSIANGPTANIATMSLRSDNLTGGAFFICD